MQRLIGDALKVLPQLEPEWRFDLILTSPPAYPSPQQPPGSLGTEATIHAYLQTLGRVLKRCRGLMDARATLCLVVQPVPGYAVMERLPALMTVLGFKLIVAHRWDHGNLDASWVLFFCRVGRDEHGLHPTDWGQNRVWLIPPPAADRAYNFWEWPMALVDAIVGMALPNGGRILDPFCGKAVALSRLDPVKFDVVGIDVVPVAGEGGLALANDSAVPQQPPEPPVIRGET